MSAEREFYVDTAERLFAEHVTPVSIADAERRIFPDALFDALHETGISAMLVPEEWGGIGADLGDAVAILRLAGRHAAPGPILETMLANRLRAAAGFEPVRAASLAFTASTPGPDTELSDVVWPHAVESLLVVGPDEMEVSTGPDWEMTPGSDTSGEPRDRLVRARRANRPPVPVEPALRIAALLRAGQMLGAIDWSLERSVEYAGERKQFGREIGKFQAIQQMLAELADHALASAAITLAAAEAGSESLIAAARSRLSDAADATVTIAHQAHGAIGFSRDYALNTRTRRLMAWRDDYGTTPFWRRTLARRFAGCSYEEFWPAITRAGAAATVA